MRKLQHGSFFPTFSPKFSNWQFGQALKTPAPTEALEAWHIHAAVLVGGTKKYQNGDVMKVGEIHG